MYPYLEISKAYILTTYIKCKKNIKFDYNAWNNCIYGDRYSKKETFFSSIIAFQQIDKIQQ